MAAIPEAVIDSVKSLGLNGSTKDTNGTLGDVVVKNICCVGAGYVGEWPYRPPSHFPLDYSASASRGGG